MQIYEWIGRGGITVFAVCAAVQDIRYRGISVRTFLAFTLLGAGIFLCGYLSGAGSGYAFFTAFIPGICLWIISKVTGGMVGEGDAMYLLTVAWYIGIRELLWMLLAGSLLCMLLGLVILACGMIRGCEEKKRSLPLTAFWLVPLAGVVWC